MVVKAEGKAGMVRFGLVTGRRIGSAVVRNRAKRRLREAIRSAGLPVGYDFVIIAGKTVADVPFTTLVSWLHQGVSSSHEPVSALHEPAVTDRGPI